MAPIINVDQVSMRFHMNTTKTTNLKEWVVGFLKGRLRYSDFYALQDISFSVDAGEVLGIIGQNGSGKSTLLKIISGVYKASSGSVSVTGRIAPMLELGSGFDYELSGRENVFLNGAILGYGEKFLRSKYDEIVEYSELQDFIMQPLKTYSSGMVTRLAFSIATQVAPEILIVDEILSVGDERFQRKSGARMRELMTGGTTVLMVSHSIDQIREMCTRALWLDHGKLMDIGDTQKVCDAYQAFMADR
ncbi:MAG: ABC transporter ATP-binding protein [Clostridia bacterium]|nr:ABC transporter ATP-binding protein [Clostridia bacterium]